MKTILFFLVIIWSMACSHQPTKEQIVEVETPNKMDMDTSSKPPHETPKNLPNLIECSPDGKVLHLRNIHPFTEKLENDLFNKRALIDFKYNDLGKIERIAFMKKDSSYCSWAFWDFKYDDQNRLVKEVFLDAKEKEIFESKSYFYNAKNQVQKIVRSHHINPYGSRTPGMVKFAYDEHNRIIKESYFTIDGKKAIIGEMGVQSITYQYHPNHLIKQSIYHYTGTVNAEDEPKNRWLNEFIYNAENVLEMTRYKFDINSEAFDNETYFLYDETQQLYGMGESLLDIKPSIPYCKIEEIVYQHLYSDYFHTHYKQPYFKN